MWDNITCWKPAHVGEIVLVSCPKFFQILDPDQGGFPWGLFRPHPVQPAPHTRAPDCPGAPASGHRALPRPRALPGSTALAPPGEGTRSSWVGQGWTLTWPPSPTPLQTLGRAFTPPSVLSRECGVVPGDSSDTLGSLWLSIGHVLIFSGNCSLMLPSLSLRDAQGPRDTHTDSQ